MSGVQSEVLSQMETLASVQENIPLDSQMEIQIPSCQLTDVDSGHSQEETLACLTPTSDNLLVNSQVLLSPAESNTNDGSDVRTSRMESKEIKTDECGLPVLLESLSEKTRNKQYNAYLDQYLANNGENLYPTRAEKEKLAKEMNITFGQITRLFANRRRKNLKSRSKMSTSSPITMMASSGGHQPIINDLLPQSGVMSPAAGESSINGSENLYESIMNFSKAIAAQDGDLSPRPASSVFTNSSTEFDNTNSIMVAFNNLPQEVSQELVSLVGLVQQSEDPSQDGVLQKQQQLLQLAVDCDQTNLNAETIQNIAKMMAFQPPNVQLLMVLIQQQLQSGASINLGAAVQQLHAILLHQQLIQNQMNQVAMQHQQQENQEQQEQFHDQSQQNFVGNLAVVNGGSSISASPMLNSDSEISDNSALSPRTPTDVVSQKILEDYIELQQYQLEQQQHQQYPPAGDRISSPPFKDPHQIADPEMTKLLDSQQDPYEFSSAYARLTEREKLAVAALAEFSTRPFIR